MNISLKESRNACTSFWNWKRVLFYLVSFQLIQVMVWFADSCNTVAKTERNIDTNWVLAMEPEELGFKPYDKPENPLNVSPYPGYSYPAKSPRVMPCNVAVEFFGPLANKLQNLM